jgi:diguanylate cyclase (GGDEF)-like protein
VKRARRQKQAFGIMFLDLDRFKTVNDSLGHDAGDKLLQIASDRLGRSIRETDMAFRMGGDEFTVVLENLDQADSAVVAANRIIESMSEPMLLNNHEVIVTPSIGISIYPKDDETPENLIKNADAAMYRAKADGRGRFEFYTADMNQAAIDRLEKETALQRALHNDEFVLHYQPKIDTFSNEVVGVEALLRWHRGNKGIVAPNEFIPYLENSGLIISVGEWVLRTACQQVKSWRDQSLPPLRLSVNISARQFRAESFVDVVAKILTETDMDPTHLELELTESVLVEDVDQAIHVMHELKNIGVKLSIDDFGTGYSSLSYLKQFPVDFLKLDRSFIVELQTNNKDAAITSAISALARRLNLGLVAEGVEEISQVDFLKQHGYNEMQGYYFAHPVPPDNFVKLFRELEKKEVSS